MKNLDGRTIAFWSISLDCECPSCGEDVDLLRAPDFGEGKGIKPIEIGTDEAENLAVQCPECDHEFNVECLY